MIQNVLRTFGGIDAYGVLSLCLFMLVFCITLVWAFLQKQSHLEAMSQLPLKNDPEPHQPFSEQHHE